jgi:hypothetical protein
MYVLNDPLLEKVFARGMSSDPNPVRPFCGGAPETKQIAPSSTAREMALDHGRDCYRTYFGTEV